MGKQSKPGLLMRKDPLPEAVIPKFAKLGILGSGILEQCVQTCDGDCPVLFPGTLFGEGSEYDGYLDKYRDFLGLAGKAERSLLTVPAMTVALNNDITPCVKCKLRGCCGPVLAWVFAWAWAYLVGRLLG